MLTTAILGVLYSYMHPRLRLVLFAFGLAILLCSLAALAYAFWPLEGVQVHSTIEPTLFSPP